MELTNEQRAILAHVVEDPDAWVDHAVKTVGEWAVLKKIDRWKADYLTKSILPGYQTRAQRLQAEAAALQPTAAQLEAIQKERLITEKMREIAIQALAKEGKITEI